MTADDIIRALEDGSIYRRTPDEWREMLRIAAQARASNPNYAHRMAQSGEIIRHLLASHDAASIASEARQQHESTYHLGKRTLVWTIVAAVAAVIAAIAALWPLLAPFFHR